MIYCAARDEYLIPCDTLKCNLPSEDNMTSDLAATEIEFESEGIAPVQPVLGSTGVWPDLLGRRPSDSDSWPDQARSGSWDYWKALADCSSVIELNPDDPQSYFLRTNLWAEHEYYDRAIADYDRAIQLDPDHALAYCNLAIIWGHKGGFDKSIANSGVAIHLIPDLSGAYGTRGLAWHSKGEYQRAIADFDKAIELTPVDAIGYINRANTRSRQGDYDQAISDFPPRH